MSWRNGPSAVVGRVLSLGVLIGFLCSFLPLSAQVQAAKEKACALHVGVLVQRPDGQPVGYLKEKDFVASQQGQVLPLTVIRPVLGSKVPPGRHVPTRALIILAPPIVNSPDAFPALLVALKPVWSRGWQVAVARSEGTATDYATSDTQLQQMWSAPAISAVNAEAAVGNLRSFTGRRIVMYLASPPQAIPPPKWLPELTASAAAEMFMVDGGVPASPLPTENVELYPGPDEPANRGAAADQRVEPAIIPGSPNSERDRGRTRGFRSGQYHEVNLHNAVQDALHVALGYYDLRIKCPSTGAMPSSDTTLSLRIEGPSTMLITAQPYGQASVPQIEITRK